MEESVNLLTISSALVATLFGLLVGLVAYIGSSVIGRLDLLVEKVQLMSKELHEKIQNIDTRVTRLETHVNDYERYHGRRE